MKFSQFESIVSTVRMARYLAGCGGNTKRAMTLYRLNLKASQEMFTLISCFEIALRNAVHQHYTGLHGADWMINFAAAGGSFDNPRSRNTRRLITKAYTKLGGNYSSNKITAEMDFGFWRYLFANPQFNAAGSTLLRIFPAKPRSTPAMNYNNAFVFRELEKINKLRNRIAHHEPICFQARTTTVDATYMRQHYRLILDFFNWMAINESDLLYGLDHVNALAVKLDEY